MALIPPQTFPSPSTRSDPSSHRFTFPNPKLNSHFKRSAPSIPQSHSISSSHSLSRVSDSTTLCRCHNNKDSNPDSPSPYDNSSLNSRWDSLRTLFKRFDDYMNSFRDQKKAEKGVAKSVDVVERLGGVESDDEDWDWERWRKHFAEVDEQERIVSVLKLQLASAVNREDYNDAARIKVAIAAAATNDTVGRVMSHLNGAVKEQRYQDAAFIRDYAGAGLVGWWAGIPDDANDPYGRIIRISAEHGRYVARSYSPRQLATATAGAPLFEIFLTINKKGEYKQQAVYLKRREVSQDFPIVSPKSSGPTSGLSPLGPAEDKNDLLVTSTEDAEGGEERDDDDVAVGLSGFENILRDMIPGVKVKVLKVTAPGKVDRDIISKVIEQIMEEEDEEKDFELDNVDAEDEVKSDSDQELNEIEMDADSGTIDGEEQSEIAVKVVLGSGLVQKLSSSARNKDLLRVPAKLENKGRLSFSFSIEKEDSRQVSGGKGQTSPNKKAKLQGQNSIERVMFDLSKIVGRGKIPMKVLRDVGELISLTLSQVQNRQPLYGSTTFSRIEIPASPDPLNGLYIGAHGLYTSEVIHLRRKFGQWQDDGGIKGPPNLEFYEYVEAVKVTGDPYVPAGQVAFRAKVGKRYQLPHKGIIPEEFGVIARYKGQGRLAEPGFQNPRWVDGELVILDGKYIKGGPVVGFVYWAPEYHFLVFFNQLRLQE
ncbi:protein EXECUTER 1, chloroplastic [Cornus florida]|uniref:protein EXECUTER 1, chloroplastic n=1 Tax=Cornus florida TaxID=4283 RepID=UPI00289FB4AF|nr:protein EXECUTER 1, chloroplastic [Cornus florida]